MGKRYGMVIDLDRCIGCHTCSMACKAEHGIQKGSWITVYTVGGMHMDTPAGIYPDLKMSYLPKSCMHCVEAPCMEVCSSGAIVRRNDGIVLIKEEECDGCQMCLEACPYQVIFWDEANDVAKKCDFCHLRIDEGEVPYCVRCCETEALHFGDLNDAQSNVSKLIKKKEAYNLLPEKGTKPSVFYFTIR